MIAILDYGAGNLTSVRLAFNRIGADVKIVQNATDADAADKLIFPGVGSAGSGMKGLRNRNFDAVLKKNFGLGKPILAICLGMQMLLETSEEDGVTAGLNLIEGQCKSFLPHKKIGMKIPHIGWNGVEFVNQNHPVLKNIKSGEAFYFVHSYYAETSHVIGKTEYCDFQFASIIGKKNLFATQFHPERSGEAGLELLKNFVEWDGSTCC